MNKARLQISIDDDKTSEETKEETKSSEEDDLNEREQPKQDPEVEVPNTVV